MSLEEKPALLLLCRLQDIGRQQQELQDEAMQILRELSRRETTPRVEQVKEMAYTPFPVQTAVPPLPEFPESC